MWALAKELYMSRLTIDITDRQHQSLKALAALQGKTIRQYALEKLLPRDDDTDGWQELRHLLAARAEEGMSGKLSARSVDAIAEEELRRDRRT